MGDGSIKSNDLRAAALAPDAATLDDACEGFHRRFRRFSSKHRLTWTQALAILAILGAIAWAIIEQPVWTWRVAYALAFALFALSIAWRWFAAARLEPLRGPLFTPRDGRWPNYTILCPLHREANVVFDLVTALRRIDYPTDALEIMLLVEADDPETIAAALGAANAPHIQVVIIPVAAPRTKPKALNVGLALARGDYVAVFDAEDRPHPAQLRAAVAAFENGGDDLACVQAPLAIDNGHASWISRQFAAEYAIQFRQVLPLLAELKLPLPLGGTSNHFRGLM